MTAVIAGLLVGAAIGSVPFAWLVHRVATGRDLRDEGSGNPGAANLERVDGWMLGLVALALDGGKGAAAVFAASFLSGEPAGVPAAVGAVLGHVFTPWLGGRGGKGVATACGAFALVAPAATVVAAAVFLGAVAVTRYVSLGSVLGAAALPLAIIVCGPGGRSAGAATAVAVLIAWRHRANFARMRAGTEPRLWGRASDRGSQAR